MAGMSYTDTLGEVNSRLTRMEKDVGGIDDKVDDLKVGQAAVKAEISRLNGTVQENYDAIFGKDGLRVTTTQHGGILVQLQKEAEEAKTSGETVRQIASERGTTTAIIVWIAERFAAPVITAVLLYLLLGGN